MRRLVTNRCPRAWGIFDHHQPTNERPGLLTERAFTVGSPQAVCCADGLFRSVVEVVPERRSHLALELNGGNQLALVHDDNVPELGRPEIARKRQGRLLLMNLRVGKAVFLYDLRDEIGKAVHILAAGDTGAFALVRFAGFQLLLLSVIPALPEGFYSFWRLALVINKV
ncbi:hypothetical protein D3C84_927330 [compost metagenome]